MNTLYIGDNLTVLKTLADNSVDHIITDPPYNTGSSKMTYKDQQKEADWLNFMRDRLVECHRVLKETGTLLIFIDQNMQVELQSLLYSVFNKRNYITTFIWKKKSSSSAQSKYATIEHDFIIAIAKNVKKCKWNGVPQFEAQDKSLPLEVKQGTSERADATDRPNQHYPLYHGTEPDSLHKFDHINQGGASETNLKNQGYPIFVEDNGTQLKNEDTGLRLAQRFDKVSKTDRNPETRPKESYPLYHNGKSSVEYDANGVGYTSFAGQGNTTEGNRQLQKYPLYYNQSDGYGDFRDEHFVETGCVETGAPENRLFSIHHGTDPGDRLENLNMTSKTGVAQSGPNQSHSIYVQQQKISLTPFPGSIEIKPMNGKKLGCWRAIPKTCQKLIDADMLVVKNGKIYQKQYAHFQFDKKTGKLYPFVRTTPIRTILQGDKYPTNLRSNKEIKEIFGESLFTYAKPTELIKNLIKIISNEGDTILDIFAGSGTTGQAAFETGRQFILIQLDEANIPALIKQRLNLKVGEDNYEVKL